LRSPLGQRLLPSQICAPSCRTAGFIFSFPLALECDADNFGARGSVASTIRGLPFGRAFFPFIGWTGLAGDIVRWTRRGVPILGGSSGRLEWNGRLDEALGAPAGHWFQTSFMLEGFRRSGDPTCSLRIKRRCRGPATRNYSRDRFAQFDAGGDRSMFFPPSCCSQSSLGGRTDSTAKTASGQKHPLDHATPLVAYLWPAMD